MFWGRMGLSIVLLRNLVGNDGREASYRSVLGFKYFCVLMYILLCDNCFKVWVVC